MDNTVAVCPVCGGANTCAVTESWVFCVVKGVRRFSSTPIKPLYTVGISDELLVNNDPDFTTFLRNSFGNALVNEIDQMIIGGTADAETPSSKNGESKAFWQKVFREER